MEQVIVGLFLTLFILEFLVEFILNELNMRHVRKRWTEGDIPAFFQEKISPGGYRKSVEYTFAKGRFQRWAQVYGALVTLFVLFGGILPYLDRLSQNLGGRFPGSTQANGILFCLSAALTVSVLSLPTELY